MENLKLILRLAAIVGITMILIDAIFPGPVKEFLFYALVTICGVDLVILFLILLYGISKSEI